MPVLKLSTRVLIRVFGRPVIRVLRSLEHGAIVGVLAWLTGCASQPDGDNLVGRHRCENFFMYSVCIADRNEDGSVDYIYFGDDFQVFMYTNEIEAELRAVEPFHICAVKLSDETRDLSSQLLYSEGMGLSDRLSVKGKLLSSYRNAAPAVEACNNANGRNDVPVPGIDTEDPFLSDDEDWDSDWAEEG